MPADWCHPPAIALRGAAEFYVIVKGEVTLTSADGYRRTLGPQSFFGERELFYTRRFSSSGFQ
jgi:hypothetical protein